MMKKEDFLSSLEISLWRALSEGMVLLQLRKKDASAPTLTNYMKQQCPSTTFNPYKTIVILEENGCVKNIGARTDMDGRRRQFYRITKDGRMVLDRFLENLQRITAEVYRCASVEEGGEHGEQPQGMREQVPEASAETVQLQPENTEAVSKQDPASTGRPCVGLS